MSDLSMLPEHSEASTLNASAFNAAVVDESDEQMTKPNPELSADCAVDVDDLDDDELPNLAKLVAATVRDRVVLEQVDAISSLEAQLGALQRVEISGSNGSPVYARGCFSKGDFNAVSLKNLETEDESADERCFFWDVGLKMVDDKKIPLAKLSNLEIRIGGVVYVTTAEVEGTQCAFGIRPGNTFDLRGKKDMTRSAVVEFNTEDDGTSGRRAALLTFHMRGFPRGHWRSLQSVSMLNRSIALRQQEREEQREERRELRQVNRNVRIERGEGDLNEDSSDYDTDEDDQEPLDVYNYLTLCLSTRHPDQRVDITSVSFCVKSVRGRLENLTGRGEDFQLVKERVFARIDNEELEGIEFSEDESATSIGVSVSENVFS